MSTSTRSPRSTWARTAIRTAGPARCVSSSRFFPRRSRAWDERGPPFPESPARMIQVEGISKGYAGQEIFRELSWRIPDRERIGLVGPNGAGKTTLCRLLAGGEEPGDGRVTPPRETTVGYLPQEAAGHPAGSVLVEALAGFDDVWRLELVVETDAGPVAAAGRGQSDA